MNANVVAKTCPQCGARFECKQAAGCWCAELPWTLPVPTDRADAATGCLCPKCLRAALARKAAAPGLAPDES